MAARTLRIGRRSASALATAAAMAATSAGLVTPPAGASVTVVSDATPNVNGTVHTIAQAGNRTIVGGAFTRVGGKPRQNVAAIRADGTLDPTFDPAVDGTVRAVEVSADGSTVFIGGRFTTAGGAARANLAAVDATTGEALTTWQADTTGRSPGVSALAVHGSRLYVGGTFSGIDGAARASIVALDAGAGSLVPGFRPRANAGIKEIVVSPDGSKVYAAGAFSKLGGAARPWGVGGVLAASGDATSFNPTEGGDLALTLALSPDGSHLYFSSPDNFVYAYDLGSSSPVWMRKTSGDTQAIAVSPTEVYIGGHFSQIVTYKIKRTFLASLDPEQGTVTDWDPNPLGGTMGVWAIALTSTHVMVGGTFTSVNGVTRVRFARFAGTP